MVFSQPVDFYAISQCLSSSISLIYSIVTNTFNVVCFQLTCSFLLSIWTIWKRIIID